MPTMVKNDQNDNATEAKFNSKNKILVVIKNIFEPILHTSTGILNPKNNAKTILKQLPNNIVCYGNVSHLSGRKIANFMTNIQTYL